MQGRLPPGRQSTLTQGCSGVSGELQDPSSPWFWVQKHCRVPCSWICIVILKILFFHQSCLNWKLKESNLKRESSLDGMKAQWVVNFREQGNGRIWVCGTGRCWAVREGGHWHSRVGTQTVPEPGEKRCDHWEKGQNKCKTEAKVSQFIEYSALINEQLPKLKLS